MSDVPEMVERASRAHSPALWKRIDALRAAGEPARDLEEEALSKMRAAIAAMRDPESPYGFRVQPDSSLAPNEVHDMRTNTIIRL